MKTLKKYAVFIGILILLFTTFLLKKVYLEESDSIDITQKDPVHKLDAKMVIDLTKNENTDLIKPDEVVEIEGIIKEINYRNNRITILLGTENTERTYVICDMQNDQKEAISKLNPKDTIKLKGVFKGFLADAIFLNCIISH